MTAWTHSAASAFESDNPRFDEAATVRFIAERVQTKSIVEFGSGTGRLIRPLSQVLDRVVGVESSEEMLAVARLSTLSSNIDLVHNDMCTWRSAERFGGVLIAFNSLLELSTQETQCLAIENAERHLSDDGLLFVEVSHPPLRAFSVGERVASAAGLSDSAALITQQLDWKTQRLQQKQVTFEEGKAARVANGAWRMVFPSELDLMARIAGLRLVGRYLDWRARLWRTHSDPDSSNCISVYERADRSQGQGAAGQRR